MLIYIVLVLMALIGFSVGEFWFWRHRMLAANGSREDRDHRSQRRVSLLTGLLACAGVMLILSGSGVMIGQRWLHITDWERTGILAAAAGCFLIAGTVVRSVSGSARQGLTEALWVISAACVGAVAAIPAARIYGESGPATTLTTSAAIAVYSFALWLMCRHELLMITALAGLVGTPCGAIMLVAGDTAPWLTVALGLWLLGLAWAALGWLYPEPLGTSISVGAAVALTSPAIAVHEVGWVYAIGIVTAAVAITASVPLRNAVLLAFGACSLLGYVTAAVLIYSHGSLGVAGSLTLLGALLVAMALLTVRLGRAARRPRSMPDMPGERPPSQAPRNRHGSGNGPEGRVGTVHTAPPGNEQARAA